MEKKVCLICLSSGKFILDGEIQLLYLHFKALCFYFSRFFQSKTIQHFA